MPQAEINYLLNEQGKIHRDAAPLEEWPQEALELSLQETDDKVTTAALEAEIARRGGEDLAEPDPEPEPPDLVARAMGPRPQDALMAALAAAQGEFPSIEKRHEANIRSDKGNYSYTYADLADVLGAVRPVLARHALALIQRTQHLEGGKVELRTELHHAGGGTIDTVVEMGQSPSNPQQFGGALTYLRRYEIVTLLGIAAEQDLDAQDVNPPARGDARPELPAWTREATDARKRQLVEALEPYIGPDRAKAIGTTIANSLGHLPDVIVATAKLIGQELEAAEIPGVLRIRLDAAEAAAEAREAEAAQQAAEQGETVGADGLSGALSRAAGKTDEDTDPAADEPEPPPQAPTEPETPAPDTLPDTPANRDDWCICTRELDGDEPGELIRNDQCPIKGHGIGF